MCGFIVTNITNPNLFEANRFVGLRGPDGTNIETHDGVTFLHDLLSITGKITTQPFHDKEFVSLFNGEIYNFRDFGDLESDGQCLIPAFRKFGIEFVNQLDGEFAIVLLDRKKNSLLLFADVFGTKPIHYGTRGREIAVGSYPSAVRALGFENVFRLKANSMLEFNLDTGRMQQKDSLFRFDLEQHKTHFDDWRNAFSSAIRKRSENTREQIFIGLSSGYDSGAISLELTTQNVNFKSFSIYGIEDHAVMDQRIKIIAQHAETDILESNDLDIAWARGHIQQDIEPVQFDIFSTGTGHVERPYLYEDGGALGLTLICRSAKAEGRKIYISGQGADEIMADYGHGGKRFYRHSNFGGLFPEDLKEIFPWASFYGSSQASYLAKEEYVAGSFGIETRYPFLDKHVVQEFLSLSHLVKNSHYKAPLRHYLGNKQFPTSFDKKIGFVPMRSR